MNWPCSLGQAHHERRWSLYSGCPSWPCRRTLQVCSYWGQWIRSQVIQWQLSQAVGRLVHTRLAHSLELELCTQSGRRDSSLGPFKPDIRAAKRKWRCDCCLRKQDREFRTGCYLCGAASRCHMRQRIETAVGERCTYSSWIQATQQHNSV